MRIPRIVSVAATVALVGASLALASAADAASSGSTSSRFGRAYPGDPVKEAAIVTAENQRLYDLRAITAAARWQGIVTTQPYSVNLGSTPTLVLVAQTAPYTIADLLNLIPSAFVKLPDGSYLLSDDVVVEAGAVLNLSNPDGMVLHLSSSSKGFVSIVGLGGSLGITGSPKGAVTIDSWDPSIGAVDNNTTDGRAYVRVIGGTAGISYAKFDHLGFWSGGTGGLALTGTQTSASDTAKSNSPAQAITPGDTGTTVHGSQVQNVGPTATIGGVASAIASDTGQYSYVSANLSNVSVSNDAYGLYVNGSQGVNISNTHVRDSLVDGIVFHRFVTNSTITSSSSNGNAVDGFAMTRASTGIILTRLTTNDNGRDGVSLDGGALASGPNPAGTAVGVYGNNTLMDGTSNGNARDGINVSGGDNIKLVGNNVASNFMGIVVSHAATRVEIRENTIRNSTQHGVSLLTGTSKSLVQENSISGADIGVYIRGGNAAVERNNISDVSLHGVTFIGPNSASSATDNVVQGRGPTAIDTARGTNIVTSGNTSPMWTQTKPGWIVFEEVFQPLTVLWVVLALVVVISALSSIGRRNKGFRHPYADQAPLSTLTRGVVDPHELGLAAAQAAPSASSPSPSRDPRPRSRNLQRQSRASAFARTSARSTSR